MQSHITITLRADQVEALENLCMSQMAAQANWMESALLVGNADRAARLANDRLDMRQTFMTLRKAYRATMGRYPAEKPESA